MEKLHIKKSLAESMIRVAGQPIESLNGSRSFGTKTLIAVYMVIGLLLPAAIVTSHANAPQETTKTESEPKAAPHAPQVSAGICAIGATASL